MYEKYNDVYRFVPLNGDIAGLCAFTDRIADSFFSPAGFNRAALAMVDRVAGSLNAGDRDELYDARINPIATFPREGYVIFGQKTLQQTPSALDRINVRRLMIYLKKKIGRIADTILFDGNLEAHRQSLLARGLGYSKCSLKPLL